MRIAIFAALAMLGSCSYPSVPPSTTVQLGEEHDLDYQISLLKEAIAQHRNRAFLLHEQAETLLMHDYLEYKNTELLANECQSIADDLTLRLASLEKERDSLRTDGKFPH